MRRRKKPKVRRTVSVTPQHYLLLESISQRKDEPMTQIVERLIEGLGRELDLHPMSHESASAEILERRALGDARRRSYGAESYDRARALFEEAFG